MEPLLWKCLLASVLSLLWASRQMACPHPWGPHRLAPSAMVLVELQGPGEVLSCLLIQRMGMLLLHSSLRACCCSRSCPRPYGTVPRTLCVTFVPLPESASTK